MKKHLLLLALSIIAALAFFFLINGTQPHQENNSRLSLLQPPFVEPVQAGTSPIGARLDLEAGISAWYHGTALNLTNVIAGACRAGVEPEYFDANSIICTVAIPGYVDQYYPHVYVHKDGWILAYYFRADPASKMADVRAFTLNNSLLKIAVATVASAGGSAFTDVNYYDFRFPNATNMLWVAEDDLNGESFTIEMPTSYIYFERSWAFYDSVNSSYSIDGTNLMGSAIYNDHTAYGVISATQLSAGVVHTITCHGYFDGYCATLITYQVP